jgi:hypothetical protein
VSKLKAAAYALLVLALSLAWGTGAHAITFADGGFHVIDDTNTFPFETVEVRDGPGGATTSLDVVGGQISTLGSGNGLVIQESSAVHVSGGLILSMEVTGTSTVTWSGGQAGIVRALGDSTLVITGGRGELASGDSATIDIFGGNIFGNSSLRDDSVVTIYDGNFDGSVGFANHATGEIHGGAFPFAALVYDFAVLSIFGGDIGPGLFVTKGQAVADPHLLIYGTGFNFPYGDLTATSGALTGVLSDGTPLDTTFTRGVGSTITLMLPEPSTGLLLGLGLAGLAAMRRRSG